jgi:hypothetical protein
MQVTAAMVEGWRRHTLEHGVAECYGLDALRITEMRDFSLLESGIEDKGSAMAWHGDYDRFLSSIKFPWRFDI